MKVVEAKSMSPAEGDIVIGGYTVAEVKEYLHISRT